MKFRNTVLFIVFLFQIFLFVSLSAVEIKDVKPSSDIYEHVIKVIEAGIMRLDNKGYFNGSMLVTRYDLAEVLSNLLDKVSIEAISKITQQMTSLKNLPEDLKKIDQRVKEIEEKLSKVDLQELLKKIENLKIELSAQLDTLESNLEYVKGYNSFVDAVNKSMKEYVKQVENLSLRVDVNEKNLSKIATSINELDSDMDYVFKEIEKNSSKILSLESEIGMVGKIPEIKMSMGASITTLKKSLKDIEVRIEQQDTKIEGIVARTRMVSDLNSEFANLKEEFSNVKKVVLATNDSLTLVASDLKKLKEENSSLKEENQNLKKEVQTLKRGIWYSIIAGIAGVSLGTLALILVWQSGT